ncbi:TerD family protein [Cellulomonas sp. NPDC055163]
MDVETSGLNASADRVLQIAVMQLDAHGALEESWSQLLDPGCDPGPVHIHGLTRARLAGSPRYDSVAHRVREMTAGRVLVAHNAAFDWRFLSAEATRARSPLTASGRLCTLALTRRLDVPVESLSLASVARYWGVQQLRAHDALDDTRVVAEVLRHSLVAAARLGLRLPVVAHTDDAERVVHPARAPRRPCPWKHPGRLAPGSALVQGMTVVFTGATTHPREALVRDAIDAGLDVMNSVSSRTSVLVTNDAQSSTGKALAGRSHATPTLSEHEFVRRLSHVQPGTPKATTATRHHPRPPAAPNAARKEPHGRLHGRRVLVLGGPHEHAAAVRARVAELGGQPAVYLSASVTDIVALAGAEQDARWSRAAALPLGWLDDVNLQPVPRRTLTAALEELPAAATAPSVATPPSESVVLTRGAVTDLRPAPGWTLSVQWDTTGTSTLEVDVVAFVVDDDEQVADDSDFCFYNNPVHPTVAVELLSDAPGEALVQLRPDLLPEDRTRVVIAAALDGHGTFGELGAIELVMRTDEGTAVARSTLDAASTETTLILATVYDRDGVWRLRAVGQGFESGLASLAVGHGVDIDD